MAVTHAMATRRAATDFILNRLNTGAATGGGYIEFQTAASAVVATCQLSEPAFGAANGSSVATANAVLPDTAAAGGTVAKAIFKDGDGTTILQCSCTNGGGGGDFEFDNVVVGAGQTVTVDSLTYEGPP